jgi:hypothetical protein
MQTGWVQLGSDWYYFDKTAGSNEGAMKTGWFQDSDGKWYYLDDITGKMLTGEHKLDWNGTTSTHVFDSSGAWLKSYDYGGMVEDDGQAYLHADEAVLTKEQTEVLRNEILGSQPTSLMNLLLGFKNAYDSVGSTLLSGTSSETGVNIENANVNMNIEQIANDYDAKRAGEQALQEILRIARKSGAANGVRR